MCNHLACKTSWPYNIPDFNRGQASVGDSNGVHITQTPLHSNLWTQLGTIWVRHSRILKSDVSADHVRVVVGDAPTPFWRWWPSVFDGGCTPVAYLNCRQGLYLHAITIILCKIHLLVYVRGLDYAWVDILQPDPVHCSLPEFQHGQNTNYSGVPKVLQQREIARMTAVWWRNWFINFVAYKQCMRGTSFYDAITFVCCLLWHHIIVKTVKFCILNVKGL